MRVSGGVLGSVRMRALVAARTTLLAVAGVVGTTSVAFAQATIPRTDVAPPPRVAPPPPTVTPPTTPTAPTAPVVTPTTRAPVIPPPPPAVLPSAGAQGTPRNTGPVPTGTS